MQIPSKNFKKQTKVAPFESNIHKKIRKFIKKLPHIIEKKAIKITTP
jgi:hypothetical protein